MNSLLTQPIVKTCSSRLAAAMSVACIVLLGICPAAHAQSSTIKYTEFARIEKNNGTLFLLECGVRSPYDGYVRWRFTNKSNITVYDLTLNDKTYTLNNDKTVNRSGEQIASKVEPMDSKTSNADAVNSEENTGSFSDKNSNRVKEFSINGPIIKFAKERGGDKFSWEKFGTLVTQ